VTLEVFLNLTWLFIAAAAAIRFAFWSHGQTRRRGRIVGLAMICALALLFPIISITDDLHFNNAVFEEVRSAALMPATVVAVFGLLLLGVIAVGAVTVPVAPATPAVVERGPPV